MKTLTHPQTRKLKAKAQRLEPIVRVGRHGLSEALIKSLDEALANHELVKVKFTEFKEEKKKLAPLLAGKTGSQLIMRVGNVAVFYRENPDPAARGIEL